MNDISQLIANDNVISCIRIVDCGDCLNFKYRLECFVLFCYFVTKLWVICKEFPFCVPLGKQFLFCHTF